MLSILRGQYRVPRGACAPRPSHCADKHEDYVKNFMNSQRWKQLLLKRLQNLAAGFRVKNSKYRFQDVSRFSWALP